MKRQKSILSSTSESSIESSMESLPPRFLRPAKGKENSTGMLQHVAVSRNFPILPVIVVII